MCIRSTAYYSLTVGAISYFGTRFVSDPQDPYQITVFVATILILAASASVVGWAKRKWRSRGIIRNSAWDNFAKEKIGSYIRVKTTDDKFVYGWLKSASTDAHKNHDIVINDPYIHLDGKDQEIGKSMFINASVIVHILVLDSDRPE